MKDFPNRCLGCKRDDVPLNEFDYVIKTVKRRGDLKIKTNNITTFPACDTCEEEFTKAMKAGNRAKIFKRLLKYFLFPGMSLVVLGFLSIFNLFVFGLLPISMDTIPMQVLVFGSVSAVFVLLLVPILKARKHPYKITNFLTFHKDGTFSINDPEYAQETKDIIQERIDQEVNDELFGIEEENAIYCPKCGKESRKGTDFCKTCGKDLRVVVKH